MPLHDVGYRNWEGEKTEASNRWWVVAMTGVRLAFRSTWLSRTLLVSWVPAVFVGVFFFVYEQSLSDPQIRQAMQGIALAAGTTSEFAQAVMTDPASVRHEAWASLILLFFRYPQAILMLLVVAMVSTRLISSDFRNKGYLLYFSRPLSVWGYMLGKAFVIWTFMAIIITMPALLLYCVGLALSPDWKVIFDTWDLPLRVILASATLMVPVSAIALACSALTSESRYAVFSWFSFWVIGWVSYGVMLIGENARRFQQQGPPPRRQGRGEPGRDGFSEDQLNEILEYSDWELISPFHVLGRVQQYVFGLYPEDKAIWPYFLVLGILTAVCVWFIRRQVLARLRA
ncbi:MAG: hypothetical protein AAF483_03725 [Planctomycetota bacterium]